MKPAAIQRDPWQQLARKQVLSPKAHQELRPANNHINLEEDPSPVEPSDDQHLDCNLVRNPEAGLCWAMPRFLTKGEPLLTILRIPTVWVSRPSKSPVLCGHCLLVLRFNSVLTRTVWD